MKALFFILFSIFTYQIVGQNIDLAYRQLTEEDGLPSNTCYDILQHSDGQLYIATEKGLARYNGLSFTTFVSPGKGKAIGKVVEDKNGNIWCSTFYGDILELNNDSLVIHAITNQVKKTSKHLRNVSGSLYMFTVDSLFKLNESTNQFDFIFKNKEGTINDNLIENQEGNPVIIVSNGELVMAIDISSGIEKNILPKSPNAYGQLHDFQLKNKRLGFLGVKKDIILLDNNYTLAFRNQLGNISTKFTNAESYKDSIIILTGFEGIYLLDEKAKLLKHYLNHLQTSRLIEDYEGNIIITTLQDGVIVIPSLQIESISYENILTDNDKQFSSIQHKDSILYTGSFGGKIIRYSLKTGSVNSIQLPIKSEVQALFYDSHSNNLLVYCDKLFSLDPITLEILSVKETTSTKDITADNDYLYFATSIGFRALNRSLIGNRGQDSLIQERDLWVNSIAYDTLNNRIWGGTKKGLFYYPKSADTLVYLDLSNIVEDENQSITKLTLFDNKVMAIVNNQYLVEIDNLNVNLRLSFNKQLFFNYWINDKMILCNYGDEVFLYDSEFNEKIVINDTKGLIDKNIVGIHFLDNKLIVVHPKTSTIFNRIPFKNRKTGWIKVKNIGETFFNQEGSYVSDYDNNKLEVEVELLPNISSNKKGKIYYKLNGIDSQWRLLNNKSIIEYERLPYGEFKLEIFGENEDGIETERVHMSFTINEPFYMTWWFIALSILGCIGVIIIIVRIRINVVRKKSQEKLKEEKLKSRALNAELTAIRSQMNPHFIFNVLSAIQSKVINDDKKEAFESINDFSRLMRSVLEKSGHEFISLNEEIEILKTYINLENSRLKDPVSFIITTDENLDLNHFRIPTLITQPIVENAIIHAFPHKIENKKITLNIKSIENGICLLITDNGIGRKASESGKSEKKKNHNSFAMKAIEKRIDRLNNSNFNITMQILDPEIGTRVIFNITYGT